MPDNMQIVLRLSLDQVNFILTKLSEFPYKDVAEVIKSIQEQGSAQYKAEQERVSKPTSGELDG